MIKLIKCKNSEKVAEIASQLFKEEIKIQPYSILGLATGSTTLRLYEKLIALYLSNAIDFSKVITFNLDEYIGLPKNHPQSYRNFMNKYLFDKLNINWYSTYFPSCDSYDMHIHNLGGIDLQLLGIGRNGHIGFNEPGTSKDSITHVVDLSEQTIKDNSRFFENISQVPKQAITMGISSILRTKKIILLATGKNKQEAIYNTLKKEPNVSCPASFLQNHPNCVFIIDEEAGGLL